MPFELFVALRFLREGRAQTVLILAGSIVGVAVIIFLSALIGGLQATLIDKTLEVFEVGAISVDDTVMAQAQEKIKNLNDLKGDFADSLVSAQDINEAGQITGRVFELSSGKTLMFVATPRPGTP